MKKYILFLFLFAFILGCDSQNKGKIILIKVNDYQITKEEFEQEFADSAYSQNDTPESRKDFLNTLVNRKLILQDAQRAGLDKKKDFLKVIQRFWEQSLLKLELDKKSKEFAGLAMVNDKEIEAAYKVMQQQNKADKPYEQMYKQIKWELTRQKESQLMDKWIDELRNKADMKINDDLLKPKE